MIYLVIILSVIIIQTLLKRNYNICIGAKSVILSKKFLVETLFTIELLYITIFRKYTVGADLRMYTRLFETVDMYSWQDLVNSKFELGYMLFTRFVRSFSGNIQVFIAITGIITVGFYLYEILHKSYNSFLVMYLSLTFGFFFFQFSMLRQAIAMALVMFAVNKLEKKKWIEYIFIVLIAGTFHISALVCLPLVFVVLFPWTDHILRLIWLVEILVLLMLRGVLEIIVFYIPRYSYILNENVSYKLGYIARIMIICALYFIAVFFCKVGRHGHTLFMKKDESERENFILILGSIGTMLMPMINYFESAQRMTYYFVPYVFFCVDVAAKKSKWMRYILPVIYCFLGVYYILCFTGYTSVTDAFGTNKFLFFWQ